MNSQIFSIPGIPAPAIPEENINPECQRIWDWVLFCVYFYPHFRNYSFISGFSRPIFPLFWDEFELNSQNSIPDGKLGIWAAGGVGMKEIPGDFGKQIQIWLIFPSPLGMREKRVGFFFLGFVVAQNTAE